MAEQTLKLRISAVVDGVAQAINSVKASLSGLTGTMAKAEAAVVLFNKALLASVIGIIVLALAQLVKVFRDNEKALKKLQPLMIGLEKIGGGIYRAFEPVLDAFIELATKALPYLTTGVGIVYAALYGLFTLIKQAGVGSGKILKGIFTLDVGLINEGWDQLKGSVLTATLEAAKAFDRYEVGLTDMTKTEKKLMDEANKKRKKDQAEAEAILKDTLEGRKKLLESELKSVGKLSNEYANLKKEIASLSTQIASIGQKGGNQERQKALQNELAQIEADFKAQRFAAGQIDLSLLFTANSRRISELAVTTAEAFKLKFGEALKTQGTVSGKVSIVPSETVAASIGALQAISLETQKVTEQFNSFLAPAVETVFGALANGSNVAEALKQSFKAIVAQLVVTIAKAAVLAAILAGLGLAAPGSGGAIKGFGKIFSSIVGLGSSQVGNPNFAGVGGNALGSVQFRLAGSDLVGSIQRTQGRINRVG